MSRRLEPLARLLDELRDIGVIDLEHDVYRISDIALYSS